MHMLLLLVVDGYLYCTTVAFKKMHEAGICLDLSDDRRSGSCLVTMCVSACAGESGCRRRSTRVGVLPPSEPIKLRHGRFRFAQHLQKLQLQHRTEILFQLGLGAKRAAS
jgi:hypothetical protein